VTDDSAFKKQVRARMAETGENYTTARRMVIAGRDPGQPRVALRVYLNPHVDLELTGETARAFAAADEGGKREMANRLLADHLELAGVGEVEVAAGSSIVQVQDLDIAEIADAIYQRIPRTAGIDQIGISGDQGTVLVEIQTARPGVAFGHGHAELDRLRAELEELTGKPVLLAIGDGEAGPREGPGDAGSGRGT
jgi:KH domain